VGVLPNIAIIGNKSGYYKLEEYERKFALCSDFLRWGHS